MKTQTQDLFASFFDPQDRRVDKLGDPLLRLAEIVARESFSLSLDKVNRSGATIDCRIRIRTGRTILLYANRLFPFNLLITCNALLKSLIIIKIEVLRFTGLFTVSLS